MPTQPKLKIAGRPRLPKGQVKSGAVKVRLNDDDRRQIEEAAKASNESMSQWIRSTLNAALEA
jgi:predicted HicB family RNase H-like nuclease